MSLTVHSKNKKLKEIFERLYNFFGPQGWWPGSTSFEIAIGAILAQNTSWKNAEKAIENLKKKTLSPSEINKLPQKKLATLIKPAGYYNQKAKKIKEFVKFLYEFYEGKMENMKKEETERLREQLLSIKGIGKETADSILLYALEKPVFVVDAYTYRVTLRHGLISEDTDYEELKKLFEDNLEKDVKLFNEYHALLVRVGKEFCKKNKPICSGCPLEDMLP